LRRGALIHARFHPLHLPVMGRVNKSPQAFTRLRIGLGADNATSVKPMRARRLNNLGFSGFSRASHRQAQKSKSA
jgi:hypothetical protein